MCLQSDPKYTEDFKDKKRGETITVWKVYEIINKKVFSPFRREEVDLPGIVSSNRTSVAWDEYDASCLVLYRRRINVYRGIHVLLTRQAAREFKNSEERVFKCTAKVNDLVGIEPNNQSAVFMKIHISKEEFNRGIKGRN